MFEQLVSRLPMCKIKKHRAQVFAQVAKEYLGSSSASPGVSTRNVYSRCTQLQRRAFFQNSYKEVPADPKSQASSIQHPMLFDCGHHAFLWFLLAVTVINVPKLRL